MKTTIIGTVVLTVESPVLPPRAAQRRRFIVEQMVESHLNIARESISCGLSARGDSLTGVVVSVVTKDA